MNALLDHMPDHLVSKRPRRFPFPAPKRPKRVFLSRSKWQLHVRIANEAAIDEVFPRAWLRRVHPQELPPDEVIALMREAEAVASSDGSHAHLLAFARPGTRCFHLDTRRRSPHRRRSSGCAACAPCTSRCSRTRPASGTRRTSSVDLDRLAPLVDAFGKDRLDLVAA